MIIYVLTETCRCESEWMNVQDVRVFTSLEEARREMIAAVNDVLKDTRNEWTQDWGNEENPISAHVNCAENDEILWTISEHEI